MAIRPFNTHTPAIDPSAYVDEMALVIGEVSIGVDSSIWPMCVVRGDVNSIHIGEASNIQDGSVLHVSHRSESNPEGFALIIGNRVTVGHKVVLHGCRIGDDCLIGMGSVVMDGAIVEDRVMLGAGSLVPPGKTLESGYLYLGSPVKRIRKLSQEELDYFSYSARHYVKLMQAHRNTV
ncbi:MAG: gamma carbonic anhydrase family protein [Gammaproteobacteria bacterium]|nr:gamma carbonic anhydrase family protein [Gammaproteobacteria bacterium]